MVGNLSLRYTKDNRWFILLGLVKNSFWKLCLIIYKWTHHIHKPIIHYYAICWNEERMLPFMFQHYGKQVDKFIIYDNYSTDNTDCIIAQHGNATEVKYGSNNSISDSIYTKLKNSIWKKSRGKADYVIVCDVDEFLYVKNWDKMLEKMQKEYYSIVFPYGYNMYADSFPIFQDDIPLCELETRGIASKNFDKCIFFDPYRIVEINYDYGAHKCQPYGLVKKMRQENVLLLHYKYLGLDYVIERKRMYKERISQENIDNGWGKEYLDELEKIKTDFNHENELASQVY